MKIYTVVGGKWDETGAQTRTLENLCTGCLFIMDVLKSSQGNKTFKTIPT